MSNIHVNDYGEYVIRLRDTFRTATEMPSYDEILSFIDNNNLEEDWGIVEGDVRKDISSLILDHKTVKSKKAGISSYKRYLEKIKDEFGIPDKMPDIGRIERFVEEYSLDDDWGISVDDVREDLDEIIAGHYCELYREAVQEAPKPPPVSNWTSKTVFQKSTPATAYRLAPSFSPKQTPSKKISKLTKEETYLLDGDNHYDEGQKGIERLPKEKKVKAYFSQAGAKAKFDAKYGERPNVTSELVKPGKQAVDKKMMSDADQLLKKGNQDITFITQDSDFQKYCDKNAGSGSGNKVSVEKSVKEKEKKRKNERIAGTT